MFGMVVERVFITDLQKISGVIERKVVAVGMSNLLIDCPAMLEAPYNSYYPRLLAALVEFFELPQDQTLLPEDDVFPEVDDAVGYQVGYSQLICARNPRKDPLPSMSSFFCFSLFYEYFFFVIFFILYKYIQFFCKYVVYQHI